MIDVVYFDMDGVLADFDRYVLERTGLYPNQYIEAANDSEAIDKFIIAHPKMFLELAPISDYQIMLFSIMELKKAGIRVEILSSAGDYDYDNVVKNKIEWLNNNFLGGLKANFVKSSLEKAEYANPNAILVDDREKSTIPFAAAGGNVILFEHSVQAFMELGKFVDFIGD